MDTKLINECFVTFFKINKKVQKIKIKTQRKLMNLYVQHNNNNTDNGTLQIICIPNHIKTKYK